METLQKLPVQSNGKHGGRARAMLYHRRRLLNAAALVVGDVLALAGALSVAGLLRAALYGAPLVPQWSLVLVGGWIVAAYVGRLLPSWGMGVVWELRRTVWLLCLLFGGAAVMLFLTKHAGATSRFTIGTSFALSLIFVPLARNVVKRVLISIDLWGVPSVIYGGARTGNLIIQALRDENGQGFVPVAVFDDNEELWGDRVGGVPVLGGTDQSLGDAPVAIIAMPGMARDQMVNMLDGPLAHYKQVLVVPDLIDVPSLWVKTRNIGGVLTLEITSKLLDPLAQATKRAVDLLLVLGTLPLWLPLCGLAALAIWLEDRKPPLFAQERVGLDGEPFRVYKFRTMVHDAEAVLQRHLEEDEDLRQEWETHFKLRVDPRITGVGRLLRRSSLDELPQLWNVLRGEMALVGPRPLPAYHHEELPHIVRDLRTRARPGMTGLWQVSGRSESGNEGMVRWDTYYVRNWSPWLDVVILVRTVRAVLRGSGAY